MLANGRTAQFDIRFNGLYTVMYRLDDTSNETATLSRRDFDIPILRIADIIEMDSINIIISDYLLADICNIAGRLWHLGIEKTLIPYPLQHLQISLAQIAATGSIPFANRNGHHPSMQFHAATMTLIDCKGKSIITGTLARPAAQTTIPRLVD